MVASRPFSVNHRLLIFILAALSMLGALSIDAYLPAMLTIAKVFAATPAATQQTLTAYLIAFAIMTLFYGTLSDSFGRRRVLLISMLLYVLSSIGAGFSTSLGMLIVFRFLQGATAGAGGVIGRAMVGDLFSGADAQRVMSYISVVFGLAPAIAPILGGWLLTLLGWRSIFWFIALFTGLLMALCARELPESLAPEKRHPFHLRLVLRNYWHVLGCARFMLQVLSISLACWGIVIYVGSAPAFIVQILHLRDTDFGWLFIPLISGMSAGSWVAARFSHRFRAGTIVGAGYAIMAVAALGNMIYAALAAPAVPWAILGPMLYCFGMALATPGMTVRALETFPRHRGLASSLQSFLFMALFAIGSGLVCPLLFGNAFWLAAGVALGVLLSALCLWAARAWKPAHAEEGFVEEDTASAQ
jgi:DHA1 family bicyclomycin/chloramphenicol resistance-like MFS transporter